MIRVILLSCLFWCSSLFVCAQTLPAIYTQLKKFHNDANYEACIKLEKQVETFALSRKDTLATNSYFYLGNAFNQLGEIEKAIPLWEKQKTLLAELNIQDEYSTMVFNLANLYMQSGNYAKAGEMADELIKADR